MQKTKTSTLYKLLLDFNYLSCNPAIPETFAHFCLVELEDFSLAVEPAKPQVVVWIWSMGGILVVIHV